MSLFPNLVDLILCRHAISARPRGKFFTVLVNFQVRTVQRVVEKSATNSPRPQVFQLNGDIFGRRADQSDSISPRRDSVWDLPITGKHPELFTTKPPKPVKNCRGSLLRAVGFYTATIVASMVFKSTTAIVCGSAR
jgi:hypothetical protein